MDELDKLKDIVDQGTNITELEHIYRTSYMGTRRRHVCLLWGAWCWSNALQHPHDVISYLSKRWHP